MSIMASADAGHQGWFRVAGAGVLTGVLTPLLQPVVNEINGSPGDFRIALLALPFAILVLALVRGRTRGAWWTALIAAAVTMVAFVCAINAAIWVDGQVTSAGTTLRNILAGVGGGCIGSAVMALGICLLPAGPRDVLAWLPMLAIGTAAGALLALDNALALEMTSVLYPVWQGGVAVGLAMALQRRTALC